MLAQGTCDRTPLWNERGSRSDRLNEAQVRVHENRPGSGQALPDDTLFVAELLLLSRIQLIISGHRRPVRDAG